MLTVETMSDIRFPLTITCELVQYFTFVLLVALVPGIYDSLGELNQSRDQLTECCMYVRQSCWSFQELLRFEWVFLGHADFDDVT